MKNLSETEMEIRKSAKRAVKNAGLSLTVKVSEKQAWDRDELLKLIEAVTESNIHSIERDGVPV